MRRAFRVLAALALGAAIALGAGAGFILAAGATALQASELAAFEQRMVGCTRHQSRAAGEPAMKHTFYCLFMFNPELPELSYVLSFRRRNDARRFKKRNTTGCIYGPKTVTFTPRKG